MPTPVICFVVAVTLALQSVPAASQFNNSSIPIMYEATVSENSNGMCPTAEERQTVYGNVQFTIRRLLTTCGDTSGWDRIAYLNMSDSSHQCPGDFREVTFDEIRLCARDNSSATIYFTCTSTTFSSNGIPYSAVCGRVVGYQYGHTLGFLYNTDFGPYTIDQYFVDGVTLTHGPVGAREHIWTFATGNREYAPDNNQYSTLCPCAINASPHITVPSFIGTDYFCESGSFMGSGTDIYYNDPLWDGDGCPEGNTCCTFSNPPYFTKQLPASTSDDIELQNCVAHRGIGSTSFGSDILIQFIELYVK